MAYQRTIFEFTYRSGVSPNFYYFTISLDQSGMVSVKNIQSPLGRIVDSNTSIPQSVTDDIQSAIQQVENFVSQTSAVNGQLTFAGETTKTVTFVTPFAGTGYRVVFSTQDFVPVRVTNKTNVGFVVQVGVTYSGIVGYDVFV
jgi:hypothetical protein